MYIFINRSIDRSTNRSTATMCGHCGRDQVGHVRGVGHAGYGTLRPRDTGARMGDNPCLTAVHAR